MKHDVMSDSIGAGKAYLESTRESVGIIRNSVHQLIELHSSFTSFAIESTISRANMLKNKTIVTDLLSENYRFALDYCIRLLDIARQTDEELKKQVVCLIQNTIPASVMELMPKSLLMQMPGWIERS